MLYCHDVVFTLRFTAVARNGDPLMYPRSKDEVKDEVAVLSRMSPHLLFCVSTNGSIVKQRHLTCIAGAGGVP